MDGRTIFRAKTVEEAIESGLQHLGLTKDEVMIEILDEGKKGILKWGSKEAEVRILVKNEQKKMTSTFAENHTDLTNKGKVWVENGKIHCKNPAEGELTIHIPPVVLFYKNNELMEQKTTITEKDQIKVDYKNEITTTKSTIELSKDRIQATIKVIPGFKSIYTLRDQKPAHEITLEAVKSVMPNLTLSSEEIHSTLKSMDITYGVKEGIIEQACLTEGKAEFIIAQGENPVEGKNGWLEYMVEINEGKRFKEREDGSIDFREGRNIPSIQDGEVIAVMHEPIPGKDGRAVTGEIIPPKPVFPLQVKVGNGAEIKDDKIIAVSMGRPSVQKRGNVAIVTVVPKFEHQGDVSMASGNLKFNGDIVISGNVENHMEIIATGNIEIRGTTSEAKIKAGQSSIHHSNVIASDIIAGNGDKIMLEKEDEINELLEYLIGIQHDLYQIGHNPSFEHVNITEGIMPLMKLLIQTKYMPLVNKTRVLLEELQADMQMLNASWQKIFIKLGNIFVKMDEHAVQTFEEFNQLVDSLKYLTEDLNIPTEMGVYVQLPSAMNSNIYSSGDVIINKQGCYNCSIHAQGTIEINGFMRGGQLFARLGATLVEAGSKGGAPTLISVPDDQTINIKNVYSYTTIQIGRKKYQFTKNMTNIVARLDEEGSIAIR